jgi:anaphase-promoting complex subunit 3
LEKYLFHSETWIALANCFSLNQDHEQAILFLKRSMQLDPYNSYAYCLAGHEYSSKEQYDKSKQYYKKALSLNSKNI